ncbi:zinc-binding dehydrogenase [Streptomyces griseoaurantiacus]|uniref:zinc-binding dehydrogenase n=1 Tax=Streptomyces griseoaurantiacus TaxID=68213 RepID=UPI0036806A32
MIGLASEPHQAWLEKHGVLPVTCGPGTAERIREASGGRVDAFIDTIGEGCAALAVELGVRPARIDTIRDGKAATEIGAPTYGEGAAASAVVLGEPARLAARCRPEVPIARTHPPEAVQEAFRALERRHTHGKIVLRP